MKCMLILFCVMILLLFKFCENKFITCNNTTKKTMKLEYAHEMNIIYIYRWVQVTHDVTLINLHLFYTIDF